MIQNYDEFSAYTTHEEVNKFVKQLISEGIIEYIEIYDKCIQNFGNYFNINSLEK